MGSKNQKKLERRFSGFRLWPLYPTGIKIGSKCTCNVFELTEMQSGTRGVQSFGAKSGASAAKPHASGRLRARKFAPQPSSSNIKLKALVVFFRTPMNRLSDLNSLGDIAV